jgi:hypothetical protein
MVHFNSDAVGLGELFAKLEPVVKAYAREHTRKPADAASERWGVSHGGRRHVDTPTGALPSRADVQQFSKGDRHAWRQTGRPAKAPARRAQACNYLHG